MRENKVKIGLEVHIQLNTKSKLFCSCPTSAKAPNSAVCEICLGMPGSKPRLNKKALDFALKLALALNCRLLPEFFFSRKTYFYPDMSKNFQITQYELALGQQGYLRLERKKKIKIRRVQLEEDPARLVYPEDIIESSYVLVDYNRSGIPLAEVVTEPEFTSPKEARTFLEKLLSILDYIGVYNKKEFTLRIDANVSIAGSEKVEIKNITGFKEVEKALNFEIVRLGGVLRRKEKIKQETRHFDALTKTTKLLRKKEIPEEYGYIFEPDLTKIKLEKNWISALKKELPELPEQKITRFKYKYKLPESLIFPLIIEKAQADCFEQVSKKIEPKLVASWFTGYLRKTLNYNKLTFAESKITAQQLVAFFEMLKRKELTDRGAEFLLRELVLKPQAPRALAQKLNLLQMPEQELVKIVKQVIKENKKAVADYKAGIKKALQFLIGQVVRKAKGRAEAKKILKIIKTKIKHS